MPEGSRRAAERLGAHSRVAPRRAGDLRDSQADIAAAREALGFEPSVDFEEGLRRTAAALLG